jgi:LacI family transcriptional regulator
MGAGIGLGQVVVSCRAWGFAGLRGGRGKAAKSSGGIWGGTALPSKGYLVHNIGHFVQQPDSRRQVKPRVLVTLGWNDPRTIRAIGQYARAAGWHLETRQFFDEVVPKNWRGEGLIVSYPRRTDLLAFVRRQALLQPTVLLGANQPGILSPQVCEDNARAGQLAAHHFLERGHRHFAWLSPRGGQVASERVRGFAGAIAAAGYKVRRLEYRHDEPVAYDWQRRQQWLSEQLRPLPRPLACYALDDQQAAEAIEVCLANGWRVPEDIAVMGTGNIEISCECAHVPISSIDLAEEDIALKAAALLDRIMKGRRPPRRPILVNPRGLVVRASTDFLAVENAQLRRAVGFIAENLRHGFSFDQVAQSAGVSRRTLYNLFRRHLSRPPAEFVAQMRMDRARQLLASSPKQPISQIASQTGFGSARTLTRLLLRHEGMSARAWRKHALRERGRKPQAASDWVSPTAYSENRSGLMP